jgi:hypothetical protein
MTGGVSGINSDVGGEEFVLGDRRGLCWPLGDPRGDRGVVLPAGVPGDELGESPRAAPTLRTMVRWALRRRLACEVGGYGFIELNVLLLSPSINCGSDGGAASGATGVPVWSGVVIEILRLLAAVLPVRLSKLGGEESATSNTD